MGEQPCLTLCVRKDYMSGINIPGRLGLDEMGENSRFATMTLIDAGGALVKDYHLHMATGHEQ